MNWKGLILGLLMCPAVVFAQDKSKDQQYSRVYSVHDRTAIDIYFMASDFARKKNKDVQKDPVTNSVTIDIAIPYQPGNNECVEDLNLTGKLTIQAKDGKTRILMNDLKYVNRDSQTGDTLSVAQTNMLQKELEVCAPPTGQVDELYSCKDCTNSVEHVNSTLELFFNQMATDYQQYLKSEILTSSIDIDR
ncbi:hypothetical protein [Polluticoccus soli]|uniref:hypothetical protein n=1 Tax=Polluticoccus soli TaxID=3034150 RepID=UPI0023E0C3E9|nr:hypothetical protein [Flavipsychrobacter sp. JY13-12]